jgi:hypothetical protein
VINDPAHYTALVDDCGWSERSFEAWLSAQLRHAVLAPTGRSRTKR